MGRKKSHQKTPQNKAKKKDPVPARSMKKSKGENGGKWPNFGKMGRRRKADLCRHPWTMDHPLKTSKDVVVYSFSLFFSLFFSFLTLLSPRLPSLTGGKHRSLSDRPAQNPHPQNTSTDKTSCQFSPTHPIPLWKFALLRLVSSELKRSLAV